MVAWRSRQAIGGVSLVTVCSWGNCTFTLFYLNVNVIFMLRSDLQCSVHLGSSDSYLDRLFETSERGSFCTCVRLGSAWLSWLFHRLLQSFRLPRNHYGIFKIDLNHAKIAVSFSHCFAVSTSRQGCRNHEDEYMCARRTAEVRKFRTAFEVKWFIEKCLRISNSWISCLFFFLLKMLLLQLVLFGSTM